MLISAKYIVSSIFFPQTVEEERKVHLITLLSTAIISLVAHTHCQGNLPQTCLLIITLKEPDRNAYFELFLNWVLVSFLYP